jgi:diguanylate cyclase
VPARRRAHCPNARRQRAEPHAVDCPDDYRPSELAIDLFGPLRLAPQLRVLDALRTALRAQVSAAAGQQRLPPAEWPPFGAQEPGPAGAVDVPAQLARVDADLRTALAAAREAQARADTPMLWSALDCALGLGDRLAAELVDGALAELLSAFTARERSITEHLRNEYLDAMQIGRFVFRVTDGLIVQADEAFAGFLGTTPDRLVGLPASRFIPNEKLIEIVEQSVRSGRPGRAQVRTLRVDRAPVTLEIIAFMQEAAEQDELQCMAVNVSEAEREVTQRRLLSAAIEASNDLVLITDQRFEIVYANPAFLATTGYDADEVIGRHPRFLQGRDSDGPPLERLRSALKAGRPMRAELVNYRKDGQPFWIDLSAVPVTAPDGTIEHWVSVGRDVSARKQAEQEITRLAMEDHLTGLPNRRAAEARLQLEWNRARRNRAQFALAIADIDRFKLINDQYGHELGDRALRHIAQSIQATLRGGDWVARWGGEEFVICFHDLDGGGAATAGERVRRFVKDTPLQTPAGALTITMSLGVSVYRPTFDAVAQMLAEADGLLYEAKQSGRDKVLAAGAASGRRGSVIWEGTQVQSALQESRVVAAFQPIVDLRTSRQVGDEALARIIGHDERLIPAAQFIEAAEALHLAASIDAAVATHALAHGSAAGETSDGRQAHFINLSPQFLANRESVESLIVQASAIEPPGVRARRFVVEITERQGGDLQQLKANLQPLVDAGFGLALDDFGSGYSSFQYLADLPIQYLKIEGWMVARAVSDGRIRQVLESIVATARRFNLITVAECVEDASTAQVLCDLGVDWAQGYFFGAPSVERDAARAGQMH